MKPPLAPKLAVIPLLMGVSCASSETDASHQEPSGQHAPRDQGTTTERSAPASFADVTDRAGLEDGWDHGVAIGDYDNDGFDDIYVSTIEGENRLYHNEGDQRFESVSASAGVNSVANTRSAAWGDFDNDGHLDLYLIVFDAEDILYMNNGDGTFSDVSLEAGIDNVARPYSVSLADVDRDGLLDIYVANFMTENVLYRNNGDGTFTDVILTSNARSELHAMGTVFFDYDNDGDPDLFLTHDGQANMLYENVGDFAFVDVSAESGVNYEGFGMGADVADIDRDGDLDVYVTYLRENQLFLNNGDKTFTNISERSRTADPGMGWGTNFLDSDNDGWADIYVANDSHFSPYPNALYRNLGGARFEQTAQEMPIASRRGSFGSGCGDFDRDGRVDLMVANRSPHERSELLLNTSPKSMNWISFALEGVKSNRSAIGARVEAVDELGAVHVGEVRAGAGFAGASAFEVHFGLGDASSIRALTLRWPSGLVQRFADLDAGTRYRIREGGDAIKASP